MARRRRSRSGFGSLAFELADVASRLSPGAALALGFVFFLVFYFALPAWLNTRLDELQGNQFLAIIEVRYHHVVRACHWAGAAFGMIGLFFCIRNSFLVNPSSRTENKIVAILARVFGRGID